MEIITDNGGCFVAANKELKDLASDLDEEKIKEVISLQKIKFHFNPPFAPSLTALLLCCLSNNDKVS